MNLFFKWQWQVFVFVISNTVCMICINILFILLFFFLFQVKMNSPNSTLIARSSIQVQPYSVSMPTAVTQDNRRHVMATHSQNGWNYGNENTLGSCAYTAYSAVGNQPHSNHRPTYPTFQGEIFPSCQQMTSMQLSPLNSFPSRGFPLYGDMYQTSPTGNLPNGVFPTELAATVPPPPRYETDLSPYSGSECNNNQGRSIPHQM